MKILLLAAMLALVGTAAATPAPPPPPPPPDAGKPMTLNDLVIATYGGGWVNKRENPDGGSLSSSLYLKPDLTYENGASGKGPGPNGAVLSAIGQGFWFARIAEDGSVEIGLTRDKADTNPSWVVRPMSDGTMVDQSGVWTR